MVRARKILIIIIISIVALHLIFAGLFIYYCFRVAVIKSAHFPKMPAGSVWVNEELSMRLVANESGQLEGTLLKNGDNVDIMLGVLYNRVHVLEILGVSDKGIAMKVLFTGTFEVHEDYFILKDFREASFKLPDGIKKLKIIRIE